MNKFERKITIPAEALEPTPAEAENLRLYAEGMRSLLGAADAFAEKAWKDAGGEGPAPGSRLFVRCAGRH